MLFVVVLLAAVFYVALFAAWNAFRPQMENSAHMIASWRDIIFTVPDPGVLVILKELILIAAVYVAFDFLASTIRWVKRRNAPPPPSWKTHKLPDYTEPL